MMPPEETLAVLMAQDAAAIRRRHNPREDVDQRAKAASMSRPAVVKAEARYKALIPVVLAFLAENPGATTSQIKANLGLTMSIVERMLLRMREEELVRLGGVFNLRRWFVEEGDNG